MRELEKYQKVNQCESLKDIQDCILAFADEEGFIQGRIRKFNANEMALNAHDYVRGLCEPNAVTREYGLRQQLMMIKYYKYNI